MRIRARGSWGARVVAYAFQYTNSGSRTRYVILGARGFHVQVWGAGFGAQSSACDFSARCGAQQFACDSARGCGVLGLWRMRFST